MPTLMPAMRVARAVVLLLVAVAPGLSACSGAASTGAPVDDRIARCARDGGVWRAQIAGGYCEIKP